MDPVAVDAKDDPEGVGVVDPESVIPVETDAVVLVVDPAVVVPKVPVFVVVGLISKVVELGSPGAVPGIVPIALTLEVPGVTAFVSPLGPTATVDVPGGTAASGLPGLETIVDPAPNTPID